MLARESSWSANRSLISARYPTLHQSTGAVLDAKRQRAGQLYPLFASWASRNSKHSRHGVTLSQNPGHHTRESRPERDRPQTNSREAARTPLPLKHDVRSGPPPARYSVVAQVAGRLLRQESWELETPETIGTRPPPQLARTACMSKFSLQPVLAREDLGFIWWNALPEEVSVVSVSSSRGWWHCCRGSGVY